MKIDQKYLDAISTLREAKTPLTIQIQQLDAFILLGVLQVVLRHPQLPEGSKRLATELARSIQSSIAPSGILAELAEEGWKSQQNGPE